MKTLDSSFDKPIKIASIVISTIVVGLIKEARREQRRRKEGIYILKPTQYSNVH